jgi:hypothetical protein
MRRILALTMVLMLASSAIATATAGRRLTYAEVTGQR